MQEAAGCGLPAVQDLPAGRGWPPDARRPRTRRDSRSATCYPRDLDHSTMTNSASPARPHPPWRSGLGLLTLYFVWGSTYLGIAVAVETIPPFLWARGGSYSPGCCCSAWSARPRRPGRAPGHPASSSATRSIVGALLLGGGMGMVALGEQTVPSGITALLIALMPLWVAVLGRIFFGERTSRLVLVGHRPRARRRGRSSSRPTGVGALALSAGRHRRGHALADQLGARVALLVAPGAAAAPAARRHRRMQMFSGAAVLGVLSARDRRARRTSRRPP